MAETGHIKKASKKDIDVLVEIEKLAGHIRVVDQKLNDYIKRNDSKIEDAQTVANVLLGKHEDIKKEYAEHKAQVWALVQELQDRVQAAVERGRDTTADVTAAAHKVSEARALIETMRNEQQDFFNKYFEKLIESIRVQHDFFNNFFAKLILAFGVQVVILLLGILFMRGKG